MTIDYLNNLTDTVAVALTEDIGDGDITAALIPADTMAHATVITREIAVIAGRPWVDEVFRQVDDTAALNWLVEEGESVAPGTQLFRVSGSARSILTAERTALNFLQTLSATATATHRYAHLIEHTQAKVLDTRKTLPGLRLAQKYAVAVGGGVNHRIGLYDAYLIKENHIAASGSLSGAVAHARGLAQDKRVEVEVESIAEFKEAIDAGPDWIMLDNFPLDDLRTAVDSNNTDIKLEASGGIESDKDFIAIAETGVDYISVGALTKHCRAIDLSLKLDTVK